MKINVVSQKFRTGPQIFDELNGYYQSLDKNFQSKHQIKLYQPSIDPTADINVLMKYMPEKNIELLDLYDLILLDNAQEPISVSTQVMLDTLQLSHCYIVTGSILHSDHQYYNKFLSDSYCLNAHINLFWSQSFYPHSYELLKLKETARDGVACFINGGNRSWRHHFQTVLSKNESRVYIHNAMTESNTIVETDDSFFESAEDQLFRDWVNEEYPIKRNVMGSFVSTLIGIDGKFGDIPRCYRLMDLYFKYKFIIAPESTYLNDCIHINEKAMKCFVSGSLPFPIGGSNTNRLYNDTGFFTAWNLLPDELKQFDAIKDHQVRFEKAVQAISWLCDHPEVFDLDTTQKMLYHNMQHMCYFPHHHQMQRFDQVINKHSKLK
jgi:hypothetical protein